MLNVLGDEGELIIKKPDGTEIKKINKQNINIDEEGPVKVEYEEGQKEIIIEVNNANNTGTIQIKHEKQINPEEEIERKVLKVLTNLEITGNLEQTGNVKSIETKSNISLEDTKTRTDFEINSKELIAGTLNENIEIKAILRTDRSKYDLFKNPKLEIELPEEIKNVTINSVNMLYGEELARQVEEVYTNETGKKVIKLEFAGEQTKHTEEKFIKGTAIIINCNLEVEEFEENRNNKLILKTINDQDVNYYKDGTTEKEVNYIIPEELKQKLQKQKEEQFQEQPQEQAILRQMQDLGNTPETTDPITLTKSISAGDGNDIYERQVQKYIIKVKNNTNQDITNIKVTDTIPEELIYVTPIVRRIFENRYSETGYDGKDSDYVESREFEDPLLMHPPETENIQLLKANEEVELYYFVRVKKDSTNVGKTVGTKAVATIGDNETTYNSNVVTNTIKSSKLQIDTVSLVNAVEYYIGGGTLKYRISVKNITSENLNNIEVKSILPNGVNFVNAEKMIYDNEYNFYYINEDQNIEVEKARI